MEREKLYKIDTKGKTRVWWIEYNETGYRTHAGIDGGKIVVSGWQYPTVKNEGKSNATTVEQQVVLEVDAEYVKKQNQGKYHPTLELSQGGAKFHEAMLAHKYEPNKHTSFPYYSQPKLDGIRCLVSKDGMQSRNGKPIVAAPHILEALDPFFEKYPDVVLDGELYNHDLKDDFEKIVSLVRKTKPTTQDYIESAMLVQYHIYDVIMDGTFEERNEFLCETFHYHANGKTMPVPTQWVCNELEVQEQLGRYLERGYEGQMLRVTNSKYEGKRSKNLLKHKEFEDAEFEIVAITEGVGNWAGYAKSIEIRLEDGTVQSSGLRGTQTMNADVLKNAHEYTHATVRYQNRTADGKLRFPVVAALWKGKRDL